MKPLSHSAPNPILSLSLRLARAKVFGEKGHARTRSTHCAAREPTTTRPREQWHMRGGPPAVRPSAPPLSASRRRQRLFTCPLKVALVHQSVGAECAWSSPPPLPVSGRYDECAYSYSGRTLVRSSNCKCEQCTRNILIVVLTQCCSLLYMDNRLCIWHGGQKIAGVLR